MLAAPYCVRHENKSYAHAPAIIGGTFYNKSVDFLTAVGHIRVRIACGETVPQRVVDDFCHFSAGGFLTAPVVHIGDSLLHVTAGVIDSHVILPICPQPCHFASYAINATKRAMTSQEEMIFSIMSLIAQDVSVQISKRR